MAGRYRLPRHEGGKDLSRYFESGSGSVSQLRRGEIRPGFYAMAFFAAVGVWETLDRRGVVGEGTGINVISFQVRIFGIFQANGGGKTKQKESAIRA